MLYVVFKVLQAINYRRDFVELYPQHLDFVLFKLIDFVLLKLIAFVLL
jgi:hypothetical protein